FQTALNVFAHRLAIDADPTRDRRDAQSMPMKIQDHDELPKLDHRLPLPPLRKGSSNGAPPGFPGRAPGSRASHLGNIQTALLGRITPATTRAGFRSVGSARSRPAYSAPCST